jgi:hypothetical protein
LGWGTSGTVSREGAKIAKQENILFGLVGAIDKRGCGYLPGRFGFFFFAAFASSRETIDFNRPTGG